MATEPYIFPCNVAERADTLSVEIGVAFCSGGRYGHRGFDIIGAISHEVVQGGSSLLGA